MRPTRPTSAFLDAVKLWVMEGAASDGDASGRGEHWTRESYALNQMGKPCGKETVQMEEKYDMTN